MSLVTYVTAALYFDTHPETTRQNGGILVPWQVDFYDAFKGGEGVRVSDPQGDLSLEGCRLFVENLKHGPGRGVLL